MTKDPLGERADPNLYRMTRNNPVNFVDPLGLKWVKTGSGWLDWQYHYEPGELDYIRNQIDPPYKDYEIPSAACEIGTHIVCHSACEFAIKNPTVCAPICITVTALTCSEPAEGCKKK